MWCKQRLTISAQFVSGLRKTSVLAVLVSVLMVDFGSPANAGDFPAANTREVRAIRTQIRAAQFLSKATFGPTQESIDALAGRISQIGYRRAVKEWINQQFAMPITSHYQVARDIVSFDNGNLTEPSIGISEYRYQAWWHTALRSEDQLRQRVGWALAQIFVISDSGSAFNSEADNDIRDGERSIPNWLGMSNYQDMLVANSSATYRKLLGDVTYHPCMSVYLSSIRNRKANVASGRFPDENYAREIMQLFSVGLYQMHQDGRFKKDVDGNLIPTYDNEGIKELARVFTGFKYHRNPEPGVGATLYTSRNLGDPVGVHALEHDNNLNYSEDAGAPESKTIFGVTLAPLATPLTDEACKAEVDEALDIIANQDNVAPFFCRLLIQRLVKSNPSRAYLRRVTRVFNDNGQGVRGDLKAVVTAVLTDPELYRGQRLIRRPNPLRVDVVTRGTEYSRLREPINRVTSFIRACRPSTDNPNGFFMLNRYSIEGDIGQMPFRSPTVFNYYLPDFQPPGDLIGYTPSRRNPYQALFAPEFQILTAVTANRMVNELKGITRNRWVQHGMRVGKTCRLTFDLNEELELAKDLNNMDEILRRFDLLLCSGTLSETTKTNIKSAIAEFTTNNDSQYVARLEEALLGVLISPDCAVEQ